jgi:DNA-binding MarR family transcriptional regulator
MNRLKSRNDAAAEAFARLFPELYLRFHRRKGRSDQLGPQGWATIHHLAWAGPLTVSELGRHLSRAQSVASEILDALAAKNLIERRRDTRDGRRTLVWLTEAGQALIAREREVLDRDLVKRAFSKLPRNAADALIVALQILTEEPLEAPTKRRSK